MILFYIWGGNLASIDESLYPTYVSLVACLRMAEALKKSGAWLPRDVDVMRSRVRELEARVDDGKVR
jgi:hypothetical protein